LAIEMHLTATIRDGAHLVIDNALDLPSHHAQAYHAVNVVHSALWFRPEDIALAIAKGGITSKRNGIWAVKPRLRDSLDEPWQYILSKTRHGFLLL
jgi:hypothetical protein